MSKHITTTLFVCISAILTSNGQKFTTPPEITTHQSVHKTQADPRVDQIDVTHYHIDLEIDKANKRIFGSTSLSLTFLENTTSMVFDLSNDLKVDSILSGNDQLSFDQSVDSKLEVFWPSEQSTSSNDVIKIFYAGQPEQDPSWGGFYFNGSYAFNLGVGFVVDPHNYGRAWFPCIDNFEDRATYSYRIITNENDLAQCNGLLVSRTTLPDGKTAHLWEMEQEIPTYLSSVAVAPYTIHSYTHKGIPVTLAAVSADSQKMVSSFENLPGCIDKFVDSYGPHTFDRIGFNLVPFNGGAMEHATNIAYPRFGANGSKDRETLMAHEFAHHWWGNTVTCKEQSDMWINEGWASFSERLFLEGIYGRARYDEEVEANHIAVMHTSHLRDGDTLAISGVDHERTYGSHVYDKGADVAHTLRGYMGDSAFFVAIKGFMDAYKFQAVTSYDLRDHFQQYTNADLTAFFDQWVFQPGFPHFDVIGTSSTENQGVYDVTLRIRQRTRFAPELYTNVPMMVTMYDQNGDSVNANLVIGGKDNEYTVTCPFEPAMVVLDREKRISDAISDDQLWIMEKGTYSMPGGLMTVTVNNVTAPSLLRVEHNWVSPDRYFLKEDLPFLSKERYWRVDGLWEDSVLDASARVTYNGRTGVSPGFGYYDNLLIQNTEDSLVLMWRPRTDAYWEEYPDYTKIIGSPTDRFGTIIIDKLRKGEYAFGMYHAELLSTNDVEPDMPTYFLSTNPNPADDTIEISATSGENLTIEITSLRGELMGRYEIKKKTGSVIVAVNEWSSGIYFVGVVNGNKPYKQSRIIIR